MIIDIKDVFIYSDDLFFDFRNNQKYVYKEFLEEMEAEDAPITMYQGSFIHERLMASSIVRGQRSNIKQSVMVLPYRFNEDRIREIGFVSIHMKYDNMVFTSMFAGVANRENPIVLVTDYGNEVEYLLCYKNKVQISEYHDTFSDSQLEDFTKLSHDKIEKESTKICVSEERLSSDFDEFFTYKEMCELIKVMTNEQEEFHEEKL